jgi:lysophospholipase L1-like esterase
MNPSIPGLAVAVLALVLVPVSALAHSAVESAPRPEEGWQKRHALINTNVASVGEKSQVIFIGDSITQGWEGSGKAVWEAYYAHRNALNLGIGGDRTQHVLWRLDNGNLAGVKPKAAVLMIGTNNSNGEDNTVEQIADGVAAIVAKLKEKVAGIKILLVPIFPRSENPSPQRGKVLQVNQIIQKLADDSQVIWMDFGHKFINSDGTIPRDLMPDYLHLSTKAYGIWAESIEARLSSILGDTPVKAAAAVDGDLSGEWVATLPGPNQEPVDMPFTLKQEGTKLTGRFSRPGGRSLELADGKVEGSQVSWILKRDRPDGTSITYDMSGKVEGGKLAGKAKADMGGSPMTIEWTAKRR